MISYMPCLTITSDSFIAVQHFGKCMAPNERQKGASWNQSGMVQAPVWLITVLIFGCHADLWLGCCGTIRWSIGLCGAGLRGCIPPVGEAQTWPWNRQPVRCVYVAARRCPCGCRDALVRHWHRYSCVGRADCRLVRCAGHCPGQLRERNRDAPASHVVTFHVL